MKCMMCGTQIKPWFEVCHGCYNPISRNNGKIPDSIMASRFMKEMKIESW